MRNNVISICKGIAIILMVLGHTEGPGFLMHIVYLFHMPIFFITAGYFFSRKYLSDSWTFVVKRFKGLYVPMVKWALFFLVIHNLMFKIGLLSEQYGNWENGVTHPYDLHAFRATTSFWLVPSGFSVRCSFRAFCLWHCIMRSTDDGNACAAMASWR